MDILSQRRQLRLLWTVLVLLVLSHSTTVISLRLHPFAFPEKTILGTQVSATCTTVEAAQNVRFRWFKNGRLLTGSERDGRIRLRTFPDVSTLVIGPLEENDSGNYTCTGTAGLKSDSHTQNLHVLVPPKWIYEPSDVNVREGDNVTVTCSASGRPTPLVKWKRKGDKGGQVPANTSQGGTFKISRTTKLASGVYICTADNGLPQVLEREIRITVFVPARFEEKFKVQTVRRGEAATLQCQAIGDSPLEITWSQDKKRLIFAPVTRYEKFESNTENGVTSELAIPTTDRSDAALYTCVAKNEYGSDERNIKLLVVEVPAQPLDLRILEVWSRKVNVIWSEPYSGNSPISSYIVHYWRDRDGAHRLMEQTVPSGQTSAMISELHPGASYSLTVTAENEVGQGPPSDPVRFLTAEEEPGGSPTDVWAAAKGPTSIAVSWKPPPRDTWNGVLKGYYVGYRAAESSQPYSFKTVETVVNGSQEVTLVGLTKSSRYSVIVKAFNAIGSGPPSEALLVYTLDGDVPFPPALTLISSTDSAFKVKWTHSKATAAPVTGYTLHYKKNAGPWHHIPVVASGDTSYTLTDLDGGATYKVYLTASNQFGRGSGSEAIIINTTDQGHDRAWVFYKDPSLLVPAASFLIAVLVVITVVTVCIKKTKAHKNFEKSLEAEKRQSYGEVTQQQQRYIDVTEKRNRSDYATIQSRRSLSGNYKIEELRSAAPNRGYNTTDAKDRRRSSLRKSSASSHVYDSAA
ncbi:cell adhesion molecule Dscam1-like isoform X2 [Dermacentor andersoni]|uniref:cell adhesion molecule Dscam1-like isoform X2 n=1 Tax=Dermacentor andersoni TaxID=34620 RepID=UPI003B3A3C7B